LVPNSKHWWETDKVNKSLNLLDVFSLPGCIKGSGNSDRVAIVQTHGNDGENRGFFLFLQQQKNQ
jgi:hypothetical protein